MTKTKILLILALLAGQTSQALSQSVNKNEWRSITSNDTGQFFYDPTSIQGDSSDRKLSVKVNLSGEAKDGGKSRLLQYSINCTDRTFLFESIKIFSESDLTGNERTINRPNGNDKRNVQPNTIADRYVNIACTVNSSNTSSATSKVTGSQSIERNQSKNKFQYFGKVNFDKNLKEAFSNVMTDEQKTDIAWGFIFANNVILKLSKGSVWQQEAIIYAPLLPKMKQGVERYLRSFDDFATTLGISRSSAMKEFNININEFGLATFAININSDIEAQMNMYIWYFSGSKDGRQLGRDLNPYYKQRSPDQLYTSVINEDIKKIELVQQRVLDNASRIENQLQANENERVRREREATLRREVEEKRIAEERQKRDDFLKSPEGQRQLAAERKAIELAEEMSRPKPIDRKKLLQDKEYTYYGDINCKTVGKIVCLVPADYEHLCKIAKSMTQLAVVGLTLSDPAAYHLQANGRTDSFEVSWNGSSNSKLNCRATITLSGIYNGSSRRTKSYGGVTSFILNSSNEVIAHNTSSNL